MLTFAHETSEQPPAPYLDVQIAPASAPSLSLSYRAKLDSGASLTVIAVSLANQWGLSAVDWVDVHAYDGHVTTRPVYEVDIIIGSKQFTTVLVTSSHRANILLGRDVMNQLCLVLDGLQQTVEVHGV